MEGKLNRVDSENRHFAALIYNEETKMIALVKEAAVLE